MREDQNRACRGLDEETLLLQRLGVCRREDVALHPAVPDAPEREEMGVLTTHLPRHACARGGEGDLPDVFRFEEHVGRWRLPLPSVGKDLDALSIQRAARHEDQRQPVRVDSEGVGQHRVGLVLHPLNGVIPEASGDCRSQVGRAVLAHCPALFSHPTHLELHALLADVRDEGHRALLQPGDGRLCKDLLAAEKVLSRELVAVE
mmetsp:Transcript_32771/g.105882  ORF Transcript_32771/g.105882 Transcript_32771/m.105882 type:complete len:204 (-) Transcript_32771:184-795(-)